MGKGEETKQAIVDQIDLVSTIGSKADDRVLASATGMSRRSFRSLPFRAAPASGPRGARARFVDVVIAPALKKPRGEARIRAMFERTMEQWEKGLPGGCISRRVCGAGRPGRSARDYLVEIQRDYRETQKRAAQIAVEEGEFREDLDLDQLYLTGFHQHGVSPLVAC
jgi:hypothetical protein